MIGFSQLGSRNFCTGVSFPCKDVGNMLAQVSSFLLQVLASFIKGGCEKKFFLLLDEFQFKYGEIAVSEPAGQMAHVGEVKGNPDNASAGQELARPPFNKGKEIRVPGVGPAG